MDLIYSLGNDILHGAPLMIKVDLKWKLKGSKIKLKKNHTNMKYYCVYALTS